MIRTLLYFWRMNLALLCAVAVMAAVLTGALIVGDSMRGSLRDLTLERLGRIESALIAPQFFRIEVADGSAPAIVLTGSGTNAASKARASRVNIYGIDQRFTKLFDTDLDLSQASLFPSVIINESLQKELHAKVGDQLLLSVSKQSDIHRETVLGSRDPADTLQTIRLTLTRILPDRGIGRFGLRPQQNLPFNAFVSLDVFQKALNQPGKINAIFTAGNSPDLRQPLRLEDYGLTVHDYGSYLSVESKEIILKPSLVETIEQVAKENQLASQRVLTYLANTIKTQSHTLPYSTVTAVNTDELPKIADDEILLNEWAVDDLQAHPGDSLKLSYFAIGPGDQLITQEATFRLKGIIPIEGLAADSHITPEFPGIHNVRHISEWDPPFPIDLNLIRPKDEDYWDRYRATPKAFITEAAGVRLWSSRFGSFTSVRIFPEGRPDFAARLLQRIKPAEMGFVFQPIRSQGLNASSGATDFGMLFLSFSLFLMVSAALIVALLFRLSIEQRAHELGILRATGFSISALRTRLLKEGVLIAALGVLPGLGLALVYAWLMMTGLRTWWIAAVGSSFLSLHLKGMSLLAGTIFSILVAAITIWLSLRNLIRRPVTQLLAGSTTVLEDRTSRFLVPAVSTISLIVAIPLLIFSFRKAASPALFFSAGVCLLISGLSFISYWLRSSHGTFATLTGMAARNSARSPGRSILSCALVACASFIILTVGANRQNPTSQGTGGFSLVAESDVPLYHDLNQPQSRFDLGFGDLGFPDRTHVSSFRLLPGDDVSCLNLYRPQRPRILGATHEFLLRDGFHFQRKDQNWQLLEQEIAPDVIPAIGDANSVQWILHLAPGEDFVMQDDYGKTVKLRIVALLQSSLFQSELLISERNFLKHFPRSGGYSYFLIDTPHRKVVAGLLEETLHDFGFDTINADEKLAGYLAVENTYLSTFQTLGGLGLLLGTLGLAIILIRNVIERRGELATLRAFGFRKSTLTWIIFGENVFLLLSGILIGGLSAIIALIPRQLQEPTPTPWLSLALTMLIVLFTGMTAGVAAVRAALRIPLLPALKSE